MNIILIKRMNELKKEIISEQKKLLVNKFIALFLILYLLCFLFWYYLSCFCAVYINTQTILFKDTIISFILSMLYPFAINLLPGFFRIPALRDKTQKSKYLYQVSGFIALI